MAASLKRSAPAGFGVALAAFIALVPMPASAAPVLDGAALSWPWSLPFVGILVSIATGPLVSAQIWSRHYGKIAAGWSALTLTGIGAAFGLPTAFDALLHAMLPTT